MDKVYIISGLLSFLSFPLIAQNSDYQAQYREKVLEYNQDLKAAGVLQFWVKCGTKFPLIDDLEVHKSRLGENGYL